MPKQPNIEGDWVWSVTKSHEELDEADREFWRSQTPDARLAATFQASVDVVPLRSPTSYAASTTSIATPNSTGQRCA